jgi:hypothetical protein
MLQHDLASSRFILAEVAFETSYHPLIHGLQHACSVCRKKHQLNVLQVFKQKVCWTVAYKQQDLSFFVVEVPSPNASVQLQTNQKSSMLFCLQCNVLVNFLHF